MKPVLFNKLKATYPEFNDLSANKISGLSYKEVKSIAKVLHKDNIITENYTTMSNEVLRGYVYNGMKKL